MPDISVQSLTEPQKVALRRFFPGRKRKAHPEINPRTASALWSLGLLQGEIVEGTRIFILTQAGERVWAELALDEGQTHQNK